MARTGAPRQTGRSEHDRGQLGVGDGHQASRMRGSSHAWSEVDDEVDDDVDGRAEEGDPHDRRVVDVEDRLDRERAQARAS